MESPRQRRSLADDPQFLQILSDLDRDLDAPAAPPRADPIVAPPPRRADARRAPLPPSIASPFDAEADDAAPTAAASGARRPLLDLFPPTSSAPATEPAPAKPIAGRTVPASPPQEAADRHPPLASVEPYEPFYGLHEKPFALSTDPRFFYHSTPHDAVSQRLLTAIRDREGLVVVTGDIGAGKTTLCRTVFEQLDRRTLTSLVDDPFISGEELLKTVLADFGVMSRDELAHGPFATRHELSTTLQAFVESLAPLQASAVVIIDEAQNLPHDVIEQVRILTESAEASSRLQVVLVGQASLTALLRRSEYKRLQQRVTVRAALGPLPPEEIGQYVVHRLGVAGDAPQVEFDAAALRRIYELSHGVPRVINLLCERALVHGCEASSSVIDATLIEAAAEDLDIGEPRSALRKMASRAMAVAALVLFALAGAGLAAWVFREGLTRLLNR